MQLVNFPVVGPCLVGSAALCMLGRRWRNYSHKLEDNLRVILSLSMGKGDVGIEYTYYAASEFH